ncbi:PID-CTERM protein-sorting domain-containing protein [uncultured Lacinutrix sp.]|uniref:PID-CTERM protein-sorting domain-containing protein n=1 Tax=uncultured Lacinutrix sp. TaxID=574032 RepID=UPI00262C99B9|nr:hypothetical protein [uncultured Lacinutrix sp.]
MIQNNKTFASILFVLISFVCSAQDPPTPSGPPTPPGTPIDGGIVMLIILGVLYGAYKMYQKRKRVA